MDRATLLVAALLAAAPLARPHESHGPPAVAFVDVTLVPMDRPGAFPHQTVVVQGERIVAVGAVAEVAVPADATRIDGAGKWLLPGLIDDHVHLFDARDLLVHLAHGVTTVRNLKGAPFHLELRERVARGELLGPRYLTSGPFLNEPVITTPEEADDAVRAQADAGYDCIKLHGRLSLETFTRLVDVAAEVGLPVVGHVPRNQKLADVLAIGGLVEIAHAEELLYTHFDPLGKPLDPREIPVVVKLLKDAGVRLTATLVAYGGIADQVEDLDRVLARPEMELLPPLSRRLFERDLNKYSRDFTKDDVPMLRRSRAFQARLVKALHDGGVPILLGTDAMNPAVVPGAAVVLELGNFVAAGLSPWDALAAATVRTGDFLALSPPIGRVATGACADLLLLDADPLADVANVARRAGVMTRGRWLARAELDRRVAEQIAGWQPEKALATLVRIDDAGPVLAAVRERKQASEPLDERFLESLGVLYASAGMAARATEVFAAYAELFPDSASARARLAESGAVR